MKQPNLYMSSSPFERVKGRLFRKELIKVGTWHKGNRSWEVTEADLHHWDRTHDLQLSNGLKVTLPVGHTDDTEANRGYVVDMEVAKNAEGIPALFGFIRFAKGHEGLAETSDVSVFVPPSYVDGKKNKYRRPIRHVALTNDPVVSGLGDFEPIAASFGEVRMSQLKELAKELNLDLTKDEDIKKHVVGMAMSMRSLAKKLRVKVADDADDTTVEEAISGAFKKMKDRSRTKPDEKEPEEKPVEASQVNIGLLRDNRTMKLDRLVETGHLTPAARKEIEKEHCSDEALAMSFSNGASNFDAVVKTLEANGPVLSFKGKTGGQTMALSQKEIEESPTVRDARKRAERAAGKK